MHKLYLICKNDGHKLIVGLAFITSMEYELKVLHNSLKEKQDWLMFFHGLQKGKGII